MKNFPALLRRWTLPLAIILGILGHSFFAQFAFLASWLLFAMLFLTFSSLRPSDLGFHPLHFMLLCVQAAGCALAWLLLSPIDEVLAQSVSLCLLIPTAAGAVPITAMLGGNVGFLTTYLFLSNIAVALGAPMLIPLMSPEHAQMPFFPAMLQVFGRVAPVMIFPLLLAWTVRLAAPKVNAAIVRLRFLSYYLWAFMILTLISSTFDTLFSPGEKDIALEIGICAAGVAVCLALFAIGRSCGARRGLGMTAGQALGQKNLLFGMWLVFQYLDSAVLICLTAYSIFQNMFNAWQIWRWERGREVPPAAASDLDEAEPRSNG